MFNGKKSNDRILLGQNILDNSAAASLSEARASAVTDRREPPRHSGAKSECAGGGGVRQAHERLRPNVSGYTKSPLEAVFCLDSRKRRFGSRSCDSP